MGLFTEKPIQQILRESSDPKKGLKRTLSARSLIALGIGALVGAGLFSLTGIAAADFAGPGVMVSYIIAAIGCGFAGLCYAEFASMIPVAGSAYTYSYATMGEFVAWIIGWDLVLEYALGAGTVASSWSGYLNELFKTLGVGLPPELMMSPFESVQMANGSVVQGLFNLPAVFIIVVMSLILIRGISQSSWVNSIIVILKMAIVVVFIIIGWQYVRPGNLHPLIPDNTGQFGHFGWSGVVRGAAIVFFAFLGFDAVSTAAQETKNPKKAMPIGILGTLIICTIIFVIFSYVMTGVADYHLFNTGGGSDLAPVAVAIKQMGSPGVDGIIHPAYPWLNTAIMVAILLGYSSVVLVALLGQSRIFYAMSADGLLPKAFSKVHPKHRTPYLSNIFFMVFVSLLAAFVPGRIIGEMVSIGTLLAFSLVCIGLLIMRRAKKDMPRAFRVPFVPWIPILGILTCLFLMVFLPFDTWLRLIIWMMMGLGIYAFYGMRKSHLNRDAFSLKSKKIVDVVAIGLSLLLFILVIVHHFTGGAQSFIFYFSIIFGGLYLLLFLGKLFRDCRI